MDVDVLSVTTTEENEWHGRGDVMLWSQDLTAKKDVQYVAGGATQNSIRAAQWLLQVPGATAYFGSVGKDEYAEKLREAATAGGVHVSACAECHALSSSALRQPQSI